MKDGEQLKIGSTTLNFYEAKGHTDVGIFTIIEPLGVWIAGDYFSNIEFPFIYSSSKDYIQTLEKNRNHFNKTFNKCPDSGTWTYSSQHRGNNKKKT